MSTDLAHLSAKLCTYCNVSKPRSEFSQRWQGSSGARYRATNAYCKPCSAGITRLRRERQRKNESEISRKAKLKRYYGLTVGDFDRMLEVQGGACAICGTRTPGGRGRFSVDHCHDTGRVRGLLCVNCNRGIGALKDDQRLLRKAIAYLESY